MIPKNQVKYRKRCQRAGLGIFEKKIDDHLCGAGSIVGQTTWEGSYFSEPYVTDVVLCKSYFCKWNPILNVLAEIAI